MIDQALETIGSAPMLDMREMQGLYLGLRRCGLSVEQAGNLTARLEGIGAVPGGWSLRDIQRLRFMRWLVSAGRLGADDRVERRPRGGFWASGHS
jgi:hypothetical protein